MMMVNWQYIKIAYLVCMDHRESPSTATEDDDVEENAEAFIGKTPYSLPCKHTGYRIGNRQVGGYSFLEWKAKKESKN